MGVDHLHKEADHPHEIWSLDGSNQVDNQVENLAVAFTGNVVCVSSGPKGNAFHRKRGVSEYV